MSKEKFLELLQRGDNWPLSVAETAQKLADALGETPTTWQTRLTNWRRDGRSAPLHHSQEEGKRPCYMTADVVAFITRRLMARAGATQQQSPQLASAKALATSDSIIVEWTAQAAFGRFRLNVTDALALGNQLTTIAARQTLQDDE